MSTATYPAIAAILGPVDGAEPPQACPCHESAGPGTAAGWHVGKGPLPDLRALHGEPWRFQPAWVDHAYRVRLDDGRWLYVAEPYSLDSDDLTDLAHLSAAGWDVSLTAWRARHYPGHTLAVALSEALPMDTPR